MEIGDFVEIGANSCVDRAALGVTSIGEGTKLDNMVHVGHNCRIGRHVVVAAQTGFSGGVVVEDYAVIGGQVGIGDKARIESRAVLGSGCGMLTSKIVRAGQVVWGTPARPLREHLEQLANLARLPDMRREMAELKRRAGGTGGQRPDAGGGGRSLPQHRQDVGGCGIDSRDAGAQLDGHQRSPSSATASVPPPATHAIAAPVPTIRFPSPNRTEAGTSDTGRFLAAGARRSYWVRTAVGQLGNAVPALRQIVAESENIILESNSILQFFRPELFLMVLDFSREDFKPSSLRFMDRADAFVVVDSGINVPLWKGVSRGLWDRQRQFVVRPPQYVTPAMRSFLRERFSVASDPAPRA